MTGGAGAIGSNLVYALLKEKAEVTVVDDLSSSQEWNVPADARFIRGSILNDEILRYAFSFKPHLVFHLAALFANQNSVEHPETDLLVNGLGTLKVLQYAQLIHTKVVCASSSSVYGKDASLPYREDSVSLKVSTPYQASKILAETYCCYFTEYYGLPTTRLRFFNSYGPGELPGPYRNVIPNFILLAKQGRPLPITGSGSETRDFTYVDDIVNGILLAGTHDGANGEDFNLGTGVETEIGEIARIINDLTGNAGIEMKPPRTWDVKSRRCADINKAKTLLGYSPSVKLSDGLVSTIRWFDQHWPRISSS